MGGRILAINEGFGYRPLLTVSGFKFDPQLNAQPPSMLVYGVQLMFGNDNPAGWTEFLKEQVNRPLLYSQLRIAGEDSEEQVYALWPKFPVKVITEETLTMIGFGKDYMLNYWVQFAGGPIQLFSQPDWWIEDEILW